MSRGPVGLLNSKLLPIVSFSSSHCSVFSSLFALAPGDFFLFCWQVPYFAGICRQLTLLNNYIVYYGMDAHLFKPFT